MAGQNHEFQPPENEAYPPLPRYRNG